MKRGGERRVGDDDDDEDDDYDEFRRHEDKIEREKR